MAIESSSFRKLAVALLIMVLTASAAAAWILHWRQAPLELDGPLRLQVERGQGLNAVAARLAGEGVLEHPRLFTFYARLSGDAGRIQAGEYELTPGASPRDLLRQLVDGRVVQYSLTVVEGWSFRDLLAAVREHEALEHQLEGLEAGAILERIGAEAEHPEGLFFPDTYHFPRGETDTAFLRRAYRTMQDHLERTWADRAEDLPLDDPYQALILASIVEKETSLDAEKPKVAGVFVRRLERGMRLQTDPTVIYGMGTDFDGDIRFRDLRRDTPYNTYTRHGLPPTPIALPGEASLRAAVRPEPGDALYFVSRGDGSHHFSATLEEHNAAVRRYQLRGGDG